MSDAFDHAAGTGSRPVPDPTLLTTQQLVREIGALRAILETRMDGQDRVIALMGEQITAVPAQIATAVAHTETVYDERFKSVGVQITERDTQRESTSRDSKVAVDAAFSAAKEAVGEQNKSNALAIAKSEAAFTKQIDQQGILIDSKTKSLDEKIDTKMKAVEDKIDDTRSRLTAIEGHAKGGADLWGYIVGAVGVAAATVTILVTILHK